MNDLSPAEKANGTREGEEVGGETKLTCKHYHFLKRVFLSVPAVVSFFTNSSGSSGIQKIQNLIEVVWWQMMVSG